MKNHARAKIYWLPPEAGGRKTPPAGPKYSTVSHFEEDKDVQPQSAWSLVLEFDNPPTEAQETTATIWFLAEDKPDTPLYLLHPGSRFNLIEGKSVVAKGEVID